MWGRGSFNHVSEFRRYKYFLEVDRIKTVPKNFSDTCRGSEMTGWLSMLIHKLKFLSNQQQIKGAHAHSRSGASNNEQYQ